MDIKDHIKRTKIDSARLQQIQEERKKEENQNLIQKINQGIVKLENLDYILTDRRYSIKLGRSWFASKKRVSIEDFEMEIVAFNGFNHCSGGGGGRGVYLRYKGLGEEDKAPITNYLHLDKRKSGYEYIKDWDIQILFTLIWDIQLRNDIRERIKEEKRNLFQYNEGAVKLDLAGVLKNLNQVQHSFRKKL